MFFCLICVQSKGFRCARAELGIFWQCARWRQAENQSAMFLNCSLKSTCCQNSVSHKPTCYLGLALTSGVNKEFSRSKAFMGSITSIPRSRVGELQNPEEDSPLAPHWRVSWFYFVCWHGYSYNFQGIFGKNIIPEIFSISFAMLCASGSATGRGSDRRDRQQAPGRYAATGGPACGDRWLPPQQVTWSKLRSNICRFFKFIS